MKMKMVVAMLMMLSLGVGCKGSSLVLRPTSYVERENVPVVDKVLASMTREDKIDQLMMVPADYAIAHPEVEFGGIFWPAYQLKKTNYELRITNYEFRKGYSIMPIIALDQEGGLVDRLKNIGGVSAGYPVSFKDFRDGDKLLSQEEIGRRYLKTAPEDRTTYLMEYRAFSKSLAEILDGMGFNAVFAPVADILPATANPQKFSITMAQEDRTYGNDLDAGKYLLKAYLNGMQEYKNASGTGVLATVKHFPGLGAAYGDTHKPGVVVTSTREMMMNRDIEMFKSDLDETSLVMMSWAKYPVLDADKPAAASQKIRSLLVDELGYKGIVISDDITMTDPSEWADAAKACDMLLTVESNIYPRGKSVNERGSGEMMDVIGEMRKAIGQLSDEELDARVRRVLEVKVKL